MKRSEKVGGGYHGIGDLASLALADVYAVYAAPCPLDLQGGFQLPQISQSTTSEAEAVSRA
jgi:hypothetical protein